MLYNNRQSVCIQTQHQDTSQIATTVCLVIYFHARINSSMRKCKKVKFMLYTRQSCMHSDVTSGHEPDNCYCMLSYIFPS